MGLIILSPSKATADLLAFNAQGAVRTSGWKFHGARPAWASEPAPLTKASVDAPKPLIGVPSSKRVLSLIHQTATRHQDNRAIAAAGLTASEWTALFQAMIEAESGYNPKALSPKGAYGLGQLMPATAQALGIDRKDVSQNLDGAARYLLAQLATFKDINLALAAYNAGPHRVVEYSGVPPFAETQTYIARVRGIQARLSVHAFGSLPAQATLHRPARPPILIDLH